MASTRPSFRMSKGEASASPDAIDCTDIMRHYRNVARGSAEWSGLPDDMPPGFIEDTALWYSPGFALKPIPGMGLGGFPAKPVTYDIYGRPVEWLPEVIQGVTAYNVSDEIYRASDTPVLWVGTSMYDTIKPYAQLMAQCLRTLGQNLTALSQPIILSGRPSGRAGDNVGAILLKSDISSGQMYIPCVAGEGVPMEVLDLKAQDHTQNLISTLSACDARILEIINTSNGIQKSSGITTEETETGAMPLEYAQGGIDALKRAWCDAVNDALGTSISYRRRTIEVQEPAPMEDGDDDDGDDDDAPEA